MRRSVLVLVLVLVIGAACGWSLRFFAAQVWERDRQIQQYAATVANAHRLYETQPPLKDSPQTAFNAVAKRTEHLFGIRLRQPDDEGMDLALESASLLPLDDGTAIQVSFSGAAGQSVTIIIVPELTDFLAGTQPLKIEDMQVYLGKREQFGYAVVGVRSSAKAEHLVSTITS